MNMSIFSVIIYVTSNLVPMHVFKHFEFNWWKAKTTNGKMHLKLFGKMSKKNFRQKRKTHKYFHVNNHGDENVCQRNCIELMEGIVLQREMCSRFGFILLWITVISSVCTIFEIFHEYTQALWLHSTHTRTTPNGSVWKSCAG